MYVFPIWVHGSSMCRKYDVMLQASPSSTGIELRSREEDAARL
jgi:hypothetical protein